MKIRLHQFLSKTGIFASKKSLVDAIHRGEILVGGAAMKDMSFEFNPAKKSVEYQGKILELPREPVYFVFYKPVGFLCSRLNSSEREHNKRSIYDFFADKVSAADFGALHSVGRLDEDTSGLLIMTTDGKFTRRVTNPVSEIAKTYVVQASTPLSNEALSSIKKGFSLTITDDQGPKTFVTKPAHIEELGPLKYKISIREGKKRQIRCMFSHFGSEVMQLQRVSIGNLRLADFSLHKPGLFVKMPEEVAHKVFESV